MLGLFVWCFSVVVGVFCLGFFWLTFFSSLNTTQVDVSGQILEQPKYLCLSYCSKIQSTSHKCINTLPRTRQNDSKALIESILYNRDGSYLPGCKVGFLRVKHLPALPQESLSVPQVGKTHQQLS